MNGTVDYVFVPKIRTRFVADDGREFLDLGPVFAEWMTEDTSSALAKRGYLNRKECKSFWQYLGRTDPAPRKLWVYLLREDFEKAFPK